MKGLEALVSWEYYLRALPRVNWLLRTAFGGYHLILAVSQIADFPERTILLHRFYLALILPFLFHNHIFQCHQNQKP